MQLESVLRNAGFRMVESLDEGDHSHFAFSLAPVAPAQAVTTASSKAEKPRLRLLADVVAGQLIMDR
jgi:hypothetical protein